MWPHRGFAASSVNYGTAPKNAYTAGFLTRACPIVASYGGRDRSLRGAAARLEKALTAAGVEHDVKEYSQAGHEFLNDHDGAGDKAPVLGRLMPEHRRGVAGRSGSMIQGSTSPGMFTKSPVHRVAMRTRCCGQRLEW